MEKKYFENGVKSDTPQSEEMKNADLVAQKIHSFMQENGIEHYCFVARMEHEKGNAVIQTGRIDDALLLEMMEFTSQISAQRMGIDIDEVRKDAESLMTELLKPKAQA